MNKRKRKEDIHTKDSSDYDEEINKIQCTSSCSVAQNTTDRLVNIIERFFLKIIYDYFKICDNQIRRSFE